MKNRTLSKFITAAMISAALTSCNSRGNRLPETGTDNSVKSVVITKEYNGEKIPFKVYYSDVPDGYDDGNYIIDSIAFTHNGTEHYAVIDRATYIEMNIDQASINETSICGTPNEISVINDLIIVGDWNFDGIMDIAVCQGITDFNREYIYYIYSTVSQSYIKAGDWINTEFDAKAQTVHSYFLNTSGITVSDYTYKWNGEELVVLQSIEKDCYPMDDIIIITTSTLQNGEYVIKTDTLEYSSILSEDN